jgi:hypothetical protein
LALAAIGLGRAGLAGLVATVTCTPVVAVFAETRINDTVAAAGRKCTADAGEGVVDRLQDLINRDHLIVVGIASGTLGELRRLQGDIDHGDDVGHGNLADVTAVTGTSGGPDNSRSRGEANQHNQPCHRECVAKFYPMVRPFHRVFPPIVQRLLRYG